jgi:hypothetical protein
MSRLVMCMQHCFDLLCIMLFVTFLDIDECAGINDCQQLCGNTEGSYVCSCSDGFNLSDDGRNCTGMISCDRILM